MNIDLGSVEVGVEDRDAVGRPRAILVFGGPGQQHDLVGDLRGRGPDLLAVHEVAAGNLLREGLDPGRVQSGIRLGETEAALIFAGDQPRNPARLLLRRALHDDRMRPEQIDVHRRGRGHAAAMACDFMHHDRGLGHPEAGAAIFLRHGDAEPAGVGHRAMKLERKLAVVVARQPVIVAEARDDRAHAFANGRVIVRRLELVGQCTHVTSSPAEASARFAAIRCGMSYILPSIPSVPASGCAANAATTRRACARSASDGVKHSLIVAT